MKSKALFSFSATAISTLILCGSAIAQSGAGLITERSISADTALELASASLASRASCCWPTSAR